MSRTSRKVSLGFEHDDICEGQHICLLFRDDERRRVMSRFLSSGLAAREKLLYLVDTMTPDQLTEVMMNYGVDLNGCKNDFEVLQAEQVSPGLVFVKRRKCRTVFC